MAIIVILILLTAIEYAFYRKTRKHFANRLFKSIWIAQSLIIFVSVVVLMPLSMTVRNTTLLYSAQLLTTYSLAIEIAKIVYLIFSFHTKTARVLSALTLIVTIYGIEFGRFEYQRNEYSVNFGKIAFKDYKIVQISDFHSVSMNTIFTDETTRLAELINKENADLILFTGDIVTFTADELDDFTTFFNSLNAKDGKIAILGNHDYGEYFRWKTNEEKAENLKNLKHKIELAGFKLLCNENTKIYRGKDSLCIVGIENWGRPPFQQLSDISKAEAGVEQNEPAILMSHDPDYWLYKLNDDTDHNYRLTLSGHTHAMQIGIISENIKVSPSSLKFKCWCGEYKREGKEETLIVFKGVGATGFLCRLGAYPEYNVIMLK